MSVNMNIGWKLVYWLFENVVPWFIAALIVFTALLFIGVIASVFF